MGINKLRFAWALCCLAVLTSCSSFYSSKDYSALHIKPMMNVQHANASDQNLYHLGRYYHRKTSYAKAIEFYQKALAVNPDYVEAHNGLGVIYSTQGQHQLALEHFQKAIRITPTATYLYNNLGYAYLIQGQNSEAAAAFQEALHFDSHNYKARQNLAMAHKRMGLSEKMAAPLTITQEPAVINANISQTLTAQQSPSQQNSNQQQLVQVAPNIYEFRINHENHQIAPIATPISAPVTVSLTISPTHLPPIASDHTKESTPKNSVTSMQHKRIEISNGNGVTGMARNIATFLKQFGFDDARLTNHQTFQHAQTEIYYRTNAHTFAEQISQIMPGQVKMIENNGLDEDTHIKILLGKDIANEVAYFTKQGRIRLTQNMMAIAP
ncbi:LytR C-terminal domain-containing protein [Nitrosomonas sp. Is37]|uniref:LytR C-terminal domain-containing protein n=1 Tax=Nitrosomonas sp. Is37 TaxID=3080535 RepID=UPI00294B6EAC|nr:tetratricopeptide repeat protein [Nitrosomonas sp. Is37]MDV6343379.1 tetratricopeptide repeat protein [Nitrosomonas sp. Is37]